MSDEELSIFDATLIARLRAWDGTPFDDDAEAAADRIKALVKERDALKAFIDRHSYAELADEAAARIQAEARAERLEAAIRELKRCWYQGDLTENDFAAALKGADRE